MGVPLRLTDEQMVRVMEQQPVCAASEVAAAQGSNQQRYSITSSANASSADGIKRPSAPAVF